MITFLEKDVEGVQYSPYNDVIVVSMKITDYDVCHILINNWSSANILLYNVFSKMGIDLD